MDRNVVLAKRETPLLSDSGSSTKRENKKNTAPSSEALTMCFLKQNQLNITDYISKQRRTKTGIKGTSLFVRVRFPTEER
jgi:hypothetical protein